MADDTDRPNLPQATVVPRAAWSPVSRPRRRRASRAASASRRRATRSPTAASRAAARPTSAAPHGARCAAGGDDLRRGRGSRAEPGGRRRAFVADDRLARAADGHDRDGRQRPARRAPLSTAPPAVSRARTCAAAAARRASTSSAASCCCRSWPAAGDAGLRRHRRARPDDAGRARRAHRLRQPARRRHRMRPRRSRDLRACASSPTRASARYAHARLSDGTINSVDEYDAKPAYGNTVYFMSNTTAVKAGGITRGMVRVGTAVAKVDTFGYRDPVQRRHADVALLVDPHRHPRPRPVRLDPDALPGGAQGSQAGVARLPPLDSGGGALALLLSRPAFRGSPG